MDIENNASSGETIELTLEDILAIATGRLNDEMPSSSASFSINVENEEQNYEPGHEVIVENGEFNFYVNGGCMVIQIDFSKIDAFEYQHLIEICKKWMDNVGTKEYEHKIFSGTIVPATLEGQIIIEVNELVYYTGIVTSDSERAILCFDNLQSNVFVNSDMNYDEIKRSVDEELRHEQSLLEQQLYEAQKEVDDLKNQSYYKNRLDAAMELNSRKGKTDRNEPSKNAFSRYTKD